MSDTGYCGANILKRPLKWFPNSVKSDKTKCKGHILCCFGLSKSGSMLLTLSIYRSRHFCHPYWLATSALMTMSWSDDVVISMMKVTSMVGESLCKVGNIWICWKETLKPINKTILKNNQSHSDIANIYIYFPVTIQWKPCCLCYC